MSKLVLIVVVNLVMDNIAKRPRGFAFIRYASEEEAKKAIEGMHGKVNISSLSYVSCKITKFTNCTLKNVIVLTSEFVDGFCWRSC